MKLKPIPPIEYDGSVDSKAFHRFITEGTAYVKDGKVPSKKRAFILAHYLKGKAHEFYMREVSGDPYRWRLETFFRELFNYCFPVDSESNFGRNCTPAIRGINLSATIYTS